MMKGIIVILVTAVFLLTFSALAGELSKISGQITAEEEAYVKILYPGQAAFFDKVIVYIVKPGDTLPKIVEMFCYTSDPKEIEKIVLENGIKNDKINPGDFIKLPIEPWRQRKPSPSPAPPNFKVKKSAD